MMESANEMKAPHYGCLPNRVSPYIRTIPGSHYGPFRTIKGKSEASSFDYHDRERGWFSTS